MVNSEILNLLSLEADNYYKAWVQAFNPDFSIQLGGHAPAGVVPVYSDKYTEYLLSIKLDTDYWLTIFHSFDYDSSEERNPLDLSLKIFSDDSNLIQFCSHNNLRYLMESTRWI